MKARDISQFVYRAEQQLARDVADIVNKSLNEISRETGLELGDITISTIESTTLESVDREWAVCNVTIDHSLPQAIWMGDDA